MLAPNTLLLLFALIVIGALTSWHYSQARSGKQRLTRRPIAAFRVIEQSLARAAETGQPIHLSPGAGAVGSTGTSTAETFAGLLAARQVGQEAARNGATLLTSTGDVVSYLALQGTLRQAFRDAGQGEQYRAERTVLLAQQDNLAYANGIATLYNRQPIEASQMIGQFGQEVLLQTEEAAARGIPQVLGAASPAALPLMLLSSSNTVIGEEIFAAQAYLSNERTDEARLRTHDALRNAVILLLLFGILYSLVLQPLLNLPPLPGV